MGVLALMFFFAYIENVFPPSPSDVVLIFAGTLIGIGTVGFFPALAVATAGSVLGFLSAYFLGRYFQQSLFTGRWGRWLPLNTLQQVEGLFQKYGYGVIVANRFLAGTRAIVSFLMVMMRLQCHGKIYLKCVVFQAMSSKSLTYTTVVCKIIYKV